MTPGIHSIPAEQYHKAAGVSRSMLEWIYPPKTPLHYKAKYIDRLIPDEETDAMQLGTITHRAILEPDTMANAFHVKPAGMKFSTKEGKAWEAEHADRPIISQQQSDAMTAMRDSVWNHPLASRLIKSADFERSAFADEAGFLLKSRFDALPRGSNAIVDLKTCESADLDSVEKSVAQFGYYRQAAFYLKVANLVGLERELFLFVFVEKSPPFAVAVYQLADSVMEAGRLTVERDLQTLRDCLERNHWPGYPSGINHAGLPAWMMKQLEEVI